MLRTSALRRVAPSLVLSLPLLLAAPGAANAQQVNAVSPSVGTVGTLVNFVGSGLMEGRPKVFLEYEDPDTGALSRRALKIVSLSDDLLVAQVNKAQPGPCTLHVKWRKDKQAFAPFEIKLPEITGISPASAMPGDQVTLTGQFFGTRVVRVKLLDRRARVLSSSDTSVVIEVPMKGLPDGAFAPRLANPVGVDWGAASLAVTGSSASWPDDFVMAGIDGAPFLAAGDQLVATLVPGAKIAFDAHQSGPAASQVSLLLPYNIVSGKVPASFSGSGFGNQPLFVQVTLDAASNAGLSLYTAKPGVQPWSVLIVAKGGNHIAGIMEATLQLVSGVGPDTIMLSDGRFLITP